MEIAVRSCNRAAQELRIIKGAIVGELLKVSISYDGSYQKGTDKGEGGFAQYCFAAGISIETGEVLSFEVACNGCRYCVDKQQALKDKKMSVKDYRLWEVQHKESCQAKDYGEYNSVALESKLAPVIFEKSIDQGLLYSTAVADGMTKVSNVLVEIDIYGKHGAGISREECLSHVQKRRRMHLVE
ncbi:hypothetical protein LOD99_7166 [Oopsacas minuta]|uniref:Mutator-like transposase domain-containing protein n=1 Tax=Oopsacas minuta TaxID=111878 RepID=A0AAV7JIW3_9METZ|nr:hypothetical protein LOD99_7166 [Oopsacas minuta]